MSAGRDDVRWSPRVPKWKLRRLYQAVSQGIWDEELVDDVGTTLFCRCRDILRIHRAKTERLVTCPRCDRRQVETLIPLGTRRGDPVTRSACGWSMDWRDYQRTYKRRQLNPGGAVAYFRRYVEDYPQARTPQDKVLAIDLLIHSFHFSAKHDPDRATRPAGVNLISGKLADVVTFLDELGSLALPAAMVITNRAWRETYRATYWTEMLEESDDAR